MRSIIKWAINNSPAMNTLMVTVLGVGLVSLMMMRREVFPEFELEIILVSVPYPGASPDEVEEGICQKMEEAVRAIDGIKKMTSIANEGSGSIVLELRADVPDVQKILNEVRSEIDRIPSFPELAEDPNVEQVTMRRQAIRVGVLGPDVDSPQAEWKLRELAEQVRDDITRLPQVSQAELVASRQYQIDIEIPEETLRRHGLTLRQIADIVRRENLELPGGTIRTDAGEVLVKGRHKHVSGEGLTRLPLLSRPDGTVLTVGDLGSVEDGFDDSAAQSWVNGQPAQIISIDRTSREDVLEMTAAVRKFVEQKKLPEGYRLMVWGDESIDVRDRLELLAENGILGLVLVFFVLAVFLELRLAFWVAMGVPFSILGACVVLLAMGQTLNMLSTFGFLMALGILVDDAIVIGENIYAHRQLGKPPLKAAIEGTMEVLPSIAASVSTTVIAFLPLLFVVGIMGKFIAVLPIAVIAMLLISLFESTFILPCHLAHGGDEHAEPQTLTARARQRMRAMPLPMRMTAGMVLVGGAALL
ncbi:MAG: efflux RND transporter permease subunit, partial [Planctomycetaceae bacterium]|nr:efflux RND transporter permease subunit [Planctomycetaceae bacterium]